MHFWAWLALAGIFVVLEILTMSLIFASFALAALIGAIGSALWSGSILQWLGFALAAVLTLAILRPFAKKYLFNKTTDSKTGFAALIGSLGVATSDITQAGGQIRFHGEIWSARTESGLISSGLDVQVTDIDGAVAIVTAKISNSSSNS